MLLLKIKSVGEPERRGDNKSFGIVGKGNIGADPLYIINSDVAVLCSIPPREKTIS